MEKSIKEINQILSKIAKENGYYVIPIKYMDQLVNNFEKLKRQNKRLSDSRDLWKNKYEVLRDDIKSKS